MNQHSTTYIRRMLVGLSAAPSVLLAYALFAISVTLTDFVFLPFAPESFRAGLIPYTGWLVSGGYAFTVFFALELIFQRKSGRLGRFCITVMLLVQIAFSISTLSQSGRPNFGNPYLTVSPWRPVWTVIIPCIWILLLHSPGMNRFCRETEAK